MSDHHIADAQLVSVLESQNQALQERLTKKWWNKREHELEDELAALQERAADEQALADKALESLDRMQERADRAEALLRRIMDEGLYEDATHALIEVYFASRPTQETDPE